MSQSDSTMKMFADSVCSCIGKLDLKTIKTEMDAQLAMGKCFTEGNMSLLMKLASERGVDITDQNAMRKIGQEVGVLLMQRGCEPFMKFSMKLAGANNTSDAAADHPVISGTLTAIETKEFTRFIVTEKSGKKHTFYWIHRFDNSDKFVSQPSKYIGKKITAAYEEEEVYQPATKTYIKIKELYGIEFE
jgi:hypothetical protein